ncbi:MAG TPA: hypothetical protein VGA21_11040 [Cyclobacteriaceae bacterium]|jgi:hypothetical protein
MKNKKRIKHNLNLLSVSLMGVCLLIFLLSGCKDNDLVKEDVPELITKASLTFTPSGAGNVIVVTATDPDGEGVQDISVDGPINLNADETYILTLSLINELADATDPEYDITDEVEAEGDEHMFFFSWTNNVFADPSGDGNIDNRSDPVNYTGASNSVDVNNRPLGLTTTWITATGSSTGTFRILLKHQPELKTDTSNSIIGETDLDITFTINIL